MSPKAALIVGAAVLAVVLGLGYVLSVTQPVRAPVSETAPLEKTTAPDITLTPYEDETPTERPFITQETVENLYYGLSYEQAEEKFGFPSDEHTTEHDPGVEGYTPPFLIHWHVWENEDGSKARLGFVNNRLDRKHYIEPDGSDALPVAPHLDVDRYGDILGIEE